MQAWITLKYCFKIFLGFLLLVTAEQNQWKNAPGRLLGFVYVFIVSVETSENSHSPLRPNSGSRLNVRSSETLKKTGNIIIFINCNWVVTRWQWLFYIYTKYEIGY